MAGRFFGSGRRKAADAAGEPDQSAKPSVAADAAAALKQGPSPNPMTNLIIADIAIRVGGTLIRHAVERTMLGSQYTPERAQAIVKGRTMTQTLVGTALARMATRSAPGAVIVGSGLVTKALYDRAKGRRAAQAQGQREIAQQARRGAKLQRNKNGE